MVKTWRVRLPRRYPRNRWEGAVEVLAREDRLFVRTAAKSALAKGVISQKRYDQIVSEIERLEKVEKQNSIKLADQVKAKLLARQVG